MSKWYLIYTYHDLYFSEFNSENECLEYLKHLKQEYKNDRDFHYRVIKGVTLEVF